MYKQLKEIKLQEILNLEGGSFKTECLKRLTDCGFIEEEKAFYERGQHFEYEGNEYVLTCFAHQQAALVNIRSGSSWSGLNPILKPTHITQEEFDVLATGASKRFQLMVS